MSSTPLSARKSKNSLTTFSGVSTTVEIAGPISPSVQLMSARSVSPIACANLAPATTLSVSKTYPRNRAVDNDSLSSFTLSINSVMYMISMKFFGTGGFSSSSIPTVLMMSFSSAIISASSVLLLYEGISPFFR